MRSAEGEARRLDGLRAAWSDPERRYRMTEPAREAHKTPEFRRISRAGQIGVDLDDDEAVLYNRLKKKGVSKEDILTLIFKNRKQSD